MARKRKNAAGAGRPAKGDFTNLASVLSVRMPADMRAQLEASAAQRNKGKGWSLTQEMLHRLQRSFDRERDERRDPAVRALCYLLAELIEFVKATADTPEPNAWWSDPYAFRVIELAFAKFLAAEKPAGEVRAPAVGARGYAGLFIDADKATPEAMAPEPMAHAAANAVWSWKKRAEKEVELSDQEVIIAGGKRIFSSEQEDQHYGMAQASRALLRSKKGEQS
jgi:hypothetical protein